MAKKAKADKAEKATIVFEGSVNTMYPDEVSGQILSKDEAGIQVQFKKKRAQKLSVQYIPYTDIIAMTIAGGELVKGAEIEVICRPKVGNVTLGEGVMVDSPIEGFVALQDEDGLTLIENTDVQLISDGAIEVHHEESDDEDEPVKKPGRGRGRKKVEEPEPEDDDDSDSDEDEEEEEEKPKKSGKGKGGKGSKKVKPEPEDEDDDDSDSDEDEEEEEKPKKSGKGKKKPKDEDEDDDDWD